MENYTAMDPWIGSKVSKPGVPAVAPANGPPNIINTPKKRILILGESWYGPPAALSTYVAGWCLRTVTDKFFSRIFNATNLAIGLHSSTATVVERQIFWDSVLFDNFINWPVGSTIASRPNHAMYTTAASTLPARLASLQPNAVWVLGIGQSAYSVPLLTKYHYVVSPHPRYGVTTVCLHNDWLKL